MTTDQNIAGIIQCLHAHTCIYVCVKVMSPVNLDWWNLAWILYFDVKDLIEKSENANYFHVQSKTKTTADLQEFWQLKIIF